MAHQSREQHQSEDKTKGSWAEGQTGSVKETEMKTSSDREGGSLLRGLTLFSLPSRGPEAVPEISSENRGHSPVCMDCQPFLGRCLSLAGSLAQPPFLAF